MFKVSCKFHKFHEISSDFIEFQLTITFALIAVAAAGSLSYVKRTDNFEGAGIGSWEGGAGIHGDYHHHYPSYKFEYGVNDPHTHDHKSQWEKRDGDKVVGEYTLDEADGTKRIVSYHADGKTGFHAEVKRVGHAHHGLF